jgi:hypothetical protein
MARRILKPKIFFLLPVIVAFLLPPLALAQQSVGETEVKKASIIKRKIPMDELSLTLHRHLLWLKKDPTGAKADLGQTDLKSVDLSGVDLQGAQFIQADLSDSNLMRSKLESANLSRVDLKGAKLGEANLSHADLTWADLTDANLRWANLSRADLSRANLTRAKLNATDLSMTDLGRVNFTGANLSGAIFSRARLKRADLSSSVSLLDAIWGDGVYYDANTKWPPAYPKPRNLGTLQGKISWFVEKYWLAIVLSTLLVLIIFVSFTIYRMNLKIKEKINELEKGKQTLKDIKGMVKFVEAVLKVASLREEVAMSIAHGRSGKLFIIGSFLMVLSVFAPFGSAIIYWQMEPLNDEVVLQLEQLKNKTGIVPGQESVSFKKDWRILFSGLSFGFLFLAAARGILRQEARQSSTYFKTAERVTYYENLARALLINDRLHQDEDGKSKNDVLIDTIIAKLLASPQHTQEEEAARDSDTGVGGQVREYLDAAASTLRRVPS